MTNPKASAQLRVWAVDVSGWNPDAAAFDQLVERLLANVDVDAAAKVRRYYRPIDRIREYFLAALAPYSVQGTSS